MTGQIYYDDIEEGMDLPSLIKHPTPRQLVMWAGVSEDYYPIHYDKDFALSQGLPGIIVHGDLTGAFLVQLITDWMGDQGTFKRLQTRNQAVVLANEDLICKGKVSRKYNQNDDYYIECEVWAENPRGEKCVISTILVTLPVRKG